MIKIILIGYMGSGKSVVAKKLSEKTGINAFDLDKIIEEDSNLSVTEIFKQKGEIYFRRKEHEFFTALITNPQDMILSLGGGTPCYANNHELLNGAGIVSVYLKASIETLAERLKDTKEHRPLIAALNEDELKEYIAKHLFDRSFYYNQATFKLNTDSKSEAAVADEILKLLA